MKKKGSSNHGRGRSPPNTLMRVDVGWKSKINTVKRDFKKMGVKPPSESELTRRLDEELSVEDILDILRGKHNGHKKDGKFRII